MVARCSGGGEAGRVWGLAPFLEEVPAKGRSPYMIYALNILLSLLTACFNPAPVGLGPGFGDTPGDPGCRKLHSTGRGVLAAPPPGILCLSALGVPYAGGELAPRGTCPTLALYLVKRNNPS